MIVSHNLRSPTWSVVEIASLQVNIQYIVADCHVRTCIHAIHHNDLCFQDLTYINTTELAAQERNFCNGTARMAAQSTEPFLAEPFPFNP